MTPVIDGQVYHFESRGLYDGVSLLWDRETGSYWHHITGESLYGPMRGSKMPVYNMLHMTVAQALAAYPDLRVAISDRPVRGRRTRLAFLAERMRFLPDRFKQTMAGEDTRRPTMDIGLGVWSDAAQRYYPMEDISAHDNLVIDEFNGRHLLVYFEPSAHALVALYTQATDASWDGEEIRLSTGEVVRRGALFDADGDRLDIERPLQVFTRWYGFALTFPETDIFTP